MSERHREALAHLVYGMNTHGGFVLVTGEVGTGKTTICRCLLEQIPENVDLAFILNPRLTTSELLATICDEFGLTYPEGNRSVKVFVDKINRFLLDAHAKGRQAVLIVDEAQNLHPSLLEQIRLLTNLETNQRKLLQIIMLGQPELLRILNQPELRQLSQRITARYHLGALTLEELRAYVKHRLDVAGIRQELFSASVIKKLFHLSSGVPRLVNVICDRALLGAYVLGDKVVKKKTLTTAAREVLGGGETELQPRRTLWWAGALAIVLVIAAFFAMDIYTFENPFLMKDQPELVLNESPVSETERVMPKEEGEENKVVSDEDLERPEGEIAQNTVPLVWSSETPRSVSQALAYEKLFSLWDVDYSLNEHGQACRHALNNGLRCLFRRGSVGSLRQINRPAVLRLMDGEGQEFFGTLLWLTDDTAIISLGIEEIEVALSELQKYWLGEFTIFWRPPPEYHGRRIGYGKYPPSAWLVEQLATLQEDAVQFLEPMSGSAEDWQKQIEIFQTSQGLKADGIVGPQTLIRLNTVTDHGVPLLIQTPGEGS